MNVRGLAMAAIVFGCIGAAESERPSAAGYATVLIRGAAKNLVLVDPRGQTCRADAISGEVPIPGSSYRDGSELEYGDGIAKIELKSPVGGRYRVFATATGRPGRIIVTVTSIPANVEVRRGVSMRVASLLESRFPRGHQRIATSVPAVPGCTCSHAQEMGTRENAVAGVTIWAVRRRRRGDSPADPL
jgi:hypothetical protein